MPELPEVENVKLSLQSSGWVGQTFADVQLLRADLRAPFPRGLAKKLKGQSLLGIHRRAKYLMFETERFYVLSHLGMTGSWRSLVEAQKHDHVVLHFVSGQKLAFNDPRRFGLLDLVDKEKVEGNRWLKHLGIEPLDEHFNTEYLLSATRGLKGPIKSFIMDQRRVVGVGNIYASEALFGAGIKPMRPAGKIKSNEAEALVKSIRSILESAIQAGGSTIRDYRNSDGKAGSFQDRFLVYDRARTACVKCGTAIKSKMIAGRNTFWCAQCQR